MAEDSVSKYLSLINHQVASQEHLSEFLSQAIAMLNVALTGDFSVFDGSTVHYYLLAIDDLAIRARNSNEQLLANWSKVIRLMNQSEDPPTGETMH